MILEWWQLAFLCVLAGGMYTSYRIGFKEGTGAMIDFCKSKSDTQGLTCIRFIRDEIEFIDPLSYNKVVLNKIVEAIEEQDDDT